MQKKMCAVCGEAAVTDQVSEVVAKFCAGDFQLDDAPWPGRPAEVDSDQIETLIETVYVRPRGRQPTYSKYPNQ